MSSLKPGRSRTVQLKPGRHLVIRDRIDRVDVSDGHKVTIYEGASLGGDQAAPPFLAGEYHHIHNLTPRKALREDRAKLVVTESTNIKAQYLVDMGWTTRDDRKAVHTKLEPGEWSAAGDKDFRNDVIEWLRVPANATAEMFDDAGCSGRHTPPLTHGFHRLSDYDLKGRISAVRVTLDEWKEVDRRPGRELSRKPNGIPIVRKFRLTGLVGRKTEEWVDCGYSETKEDHWEASATIGISTTIGTGESSPVKAEVTVSAESTAGGGGSDSKEGHRNAGTTVEAEILEPDESGGRTGQVTGSVIFRPAQVETEIIVTLKNQRTGKLAEQVKIETAHLFESETVFDD